MNYKFKIKDKQQSTALQNVLFSMGHAWSDGDTTVYEPRNSTIGFIYSDHRKFSYGQEGYTVSFNQNDNTEYDTDQFIKEHTMTKTLLTPHKHAELIKLWADGAEIEFCDEEYAAWETTLTPTWDHYIAYRVKPVRIFPVTSLSRTNMINIFVGDNPNPCSYTALANSAIKQHILDTESK